MSTYHAYFTVVLFVIMVGIIFWAYSGKRKSSFEEAANIPFTDANHSEVGANNPSTFSEQNHDQGARS